MSRSHYVVLAIGMVIGFFGALGFGWWLAEADSGEDSILVRVHKTPDALLPILEDATGFVHAGTIRGVSVVSGEGENGFRIALIASNEFLSPMVSWEQRGAKVDVSIWEPFFETSISWRFVGDTLQVVSLSQPAGQGLSRVMLDRNLDGVYEQAVTGPVATKPRSITVGGEDWNLEIDGRRLFAVKGEVTREVIRTGGSFQFVGEKPSNDGKTP